jgi:ribosome-associated protein
MSEFPRSALSLRTLSITTSPAAQNDPTLALALTIAQAAEERKGAHIRVLKVTEVSYLADYFVIVTGFSAVQVRAIARTIEDAVEEVWQRRPLNVEGQAEGTWVLLDYGEVIAHVFMPDEREFYGLEAFWGHAEVVPFPLSIESALGATMFREPLR